MIFAKKFPTLTACSLAFVGGALGVFAYSPFDYWLLAFVSAAMLIWAATLAEKKQALWATFTWSLGYFSIGVHWVQVSMSQFGGVPPAVGYLLVIALAAYLSLYNLLFAWIIQRVKLRQNPFAVTVIFTLTEYLRAVVFTGFPWLQFGYSLIDSPFAGIAPILGVEGLTAFVMIFSSCAVFLVRSLSQAKKIRPFDLISISSITLAAYLSGMLNFVQIDPHNKPLTVSLVQGNIEQKMKWDPQHFVHTIRTYHQLIETQLGKSDVIILPESAFGTTEEHLVWLYEQWHELAENSESEIIIGSLYRSPEEQLYNSAFRLGNPNQPYALHETERYKKHHLVPFGEYVPFGNLLNWLRDVFILPVNLSQGDFIQAPLEAKQRKFNLAICYEIIFGKQLQRNQAHSAQDYLLTITNDAWFGESIGPWQHFQIARMRALELGKPLLRAANTGITAVVNADGSVQAQLPQFEEGVLNAEIAQTIGKTPYAQYGELPIHLFGIFVLLYTLLRRPPRK